jgi:hypothetical protein
MDARIDQLLDAFRHASEGPPADTTAFFRSLPDAGALPSPWETWTLIGLVHHHTRQVWVRDLQRAREFAHQPEMRIRLLCVGVVAALQRTGI